MTARKEYSTRFRNTWSRHWWYVWLPSRFSQLTTSFQDSTDKFFDDINLRQSIDDLHAAVVDAKLRKQRGEVRPDTWRENLNPRAATRARTVPLLEKERERLLTELQEVFSLIRFIRYYSYPVQLEEENLKLQEVMASNVEQFNENEKKTESLLDVLDEVGIFLQFPFPSSHTHIGSPGVGTASRR